MPIRFITIMVLIFVTVFNTSCRKNKFACQCAQQKEGTGIRRYDIAASNRKNARVDCRNFELKLNSPDALYTCRLE